MEDGGREPLALIAFNAQSRLIGRVLDHELSAVIDTDWFIRRLSTALELRHRVFNSPYYRWIHAEADGLPGLVIDRFNDAVVVQPNAAWVDGMLPELVSAIQSVAPEIKTIVKNASGRARRLEGLDDETEILTGSIDGPIPVPMNNATYMADLTGGQKTGLFYDQRPNHAFFANLARGGTVLDVFSHVGGFGLAALAGGATSAHAVDGSQPALDLAAAGADAMGRGGDFTTQKSDAFAALEEMVATGAKFDAVVCDPPAFAPSKKILGQGLRAYERVAKLGAGLVKPGGYLCLCSCSHAAELPKFLGSCSRGIGRAGRKGQLIHTGFAGPDHPQHTMLGEIGYLKALFFRITA